jgi:hypothetical protein
MGQPRRRLPLMQRLQARPVATESTSATPAPLLKADADMTPGFLETPNPDPPPGFGETNLTRKRVAP